MFPEGETGGRVGQAMFCFFVAHMVVSSLLAPLNGRLPLYFLSEAEREAMRWVAANTAEDSEFVVIASWDSWPGDATSEWFPALTGRVSLATVQGSEWLSSGEYRRRVDRYDQLSECAGEDVSCVETWAKQGGITLTHVYISKTCPGSGLLNYRKCCVSLENSFRSASDYTLLYEGAGGMIVRRVAPNSGGRSAR